MEGKNKTKLTEEKSSIIYLGHIPKGFYEIEMRKFFAQFGVIQRLKLFRSRKTLNSKGYAFIEFESPEVAISVAEAMDGYFLKERQLIARIIPFEKHHTRMFYRLRPKRKSKSEIDGSFSSKLIQRNLHNPDLLHNVISRKYMDKLKKKQTKLNNLGIDYDISAV